MRLNTLLSFIGFVVLLAATYCPLLRPFHLFNMDSFDMNKPYGIVLLLVAVIGIMGTVFNQPKIIKAVSLTALALAFLLFIAAMLKVHTSFSFIPFHAVDRFLTRQIAFKWGWYVLFAGPLLSVAGYYIKSKTNLNKTAVVN